MARVPLAFVAGVVGIAFAAIFVRLALPAPPVVTGFYRMLFATTVLLALWPTWRRQPSGSARTRWLALAAGACFGTDIGLWNTSLTLTSVATSTFLVNTTPIYVGLWTVAVLGRSLDRRFLAGALLAMAGCAVLLGIHWDEATRTSGAVLALTAGLFYAAYLLLITAARREVDAVPALALASIGATLALGIGALVRGDPLSGFPAHSWGFFAVSALVSQLIGVFGIVWSLRFLPTTLASVGLLAQPVVTALLGWWLLDEALTGLQSLGGLAVLGGIALASRSGRGQARAEPARIQRR